MDFALLKALTSTHVEAEQGVLLIYDIPCQYFVHLQDWISSRLPFGLDIEAAIGLFHVHAHKDQCFFRYATSFIPGAAIIAGEILESLWSSLNAISPTAQTATLAHRAEMLDDHTTDSNHKKTLGIVNTLCRSHQTAVDMLDHAQIYYRNLTDQAGPTAVAKWDQDIESLKQCINTTSPQWIYMLQDWRIGSRHPGIRHLAPATHSLLHGWNCLLRWKRNSELHQV